MSCLQSTVQIQIFHKLEQRNIFSLKKVFKLLICYQCCQKLLSMRPFLLFYFWSLFKKLLLSVLHNVLLWGFCRRRGPYETAHSWRLETQTIASPGKSVLTWATAADRSLSAETPSRARHWLQMNLVSNAVVTRHHTVMSLRRLHDTDMKPFNQCISLSVLMFYRLCLWEKGLAG